jgi:antitoxin component of MazEF toxin-antitoxin module
MPNTYPAAIVWTGSTTAVALPAEAQNALGVTMGDAVYVTVDGTTVTLHASPVAPVAPVEPAA